MDPSRKSVEEVAGAKSSRSAMPNPATSSTLFRLGSRRSKILQIRHAESCGPCGFTFEDDGHPDPGHAVCRHETRNRFFDFGALLSRKTLLLRGDDRSAGEEQGEQANDLRSEAVGLGKSRTGLHGITSSASLSQNQGGPEQRRGRSRLVLRASTPVCRNALTLW